MDLGLGRHDTGDSIMSSKFFAHDSSNRIRQIVREELRARASDASLSYDAMCAAVDATVYDVPQSRAPVQPTDNLHRRNGLQNAVIQPPTMVSSWDSHWCTVPRGRFGDVREAPVCFLVFVDLWLKFALKDVAHHSATTRDHRLLIDKTTGAGVCAQFGTRRLGTASSKMPAVTCTSDAVSTRTSAATHPPP
ncbi:hypothetical protein HPB52_002976 [Rhipicephalus sanguineus]|uniref:Uncharacterized protein n=1 Tax=Rhipicephalus sanguineus TaxID=34632 RepID=A0A9D4Q9E0_RHISA|nr:hypothetical protein HPB52_002976 [Rhipicephalus sanguineus]